MPRLLLLIPTTSYRTEAFMSAACGLGVDVVVAADKPSSFQAAFPEHLATLSFHSPAEAIEEARLLARQRPIVAVVGVDDQTALVATAVSHGLGLPANPVAAVKAACDKVALREQLQAKGVPTPRHRVLTVGGTEMPDLGALVFPLVVKPTRLAASRGVIRVNDPAALCAARARIQAILAAPDVVERGLAAADLVVEEFIPGPEVAVEGLLMEGELHVLAIFDKPDPLDGPFFEETIYVTPSRLSSARQEAIGDCCQRAAAALGLIEGPVHAELRLTADGPVIIELAARTIGGLCSPTLRFGTGMSLEEIVIRHALRRDIPSLRREALAAGVMMLPTPRAGVLDTVTGQEAARALPGIEEVTITAHSGQRLLPLPEGHHYLGFVFARGDDPASVEAALRRAAAALDVVYEPEP